MTLATACIRRYAAMISAGYSGMISRIIGNARAGKTYRKRVCKQYGKGKNPCECSPVTLTAACIRRKRGDGMRRGLGNDIEKGRKIRGRIGRRRTGDFTAFM